MHYSNHSMMALLFCAGLSFCGAMVPQAASAQVTASTSSTATGTVLDQDGDPVFGAKVTALGLDKSTQTDTDGKFFLSDVPAGTTLRITYLGARTEDVKWAGSTLNIQLKAPESNPGRAVVTAMGIVRKEKSLTYATQQIKSDDFMKVQDVNIANSIEGKVSGVTITASAGGAGGGSKIIMRGNKSILGSSTPLIVVDGVPMTNNIRGQINSAETMTYQGVVEGSDPLSQINPDDIESMQILKGANAAALYGSKAANGVVMITTKKGKQGKIDVTYTGNITFETPLLMPKIQKIYGAPISPTGQLMSADGWGGKISETPDYVYQPYSSDATVDMVISPDGNPNRQVFMRNYGRNNLDDFYRTSTTTNNSLALSGGTDLIQTYFSMANSHSTGLVPSNNYNRNTFAFRQTYNLFKNRVKFEASLNYVQTKTKNRVGGGTVMNPIYHLYVTPNNVDMEYYRHNYAGTGVWNSTLQTYYKQNEDGTYDKVNESIRLSGLMQNWAYMQALQNNPYWLLKQNTGINKEDRVYGAFAANVKIIDGLTFEARVGIDHSKYDSETKRYATTLLPATMEDYGRYWRILNRTTELYTNFLLSYNKTFAEDWSVSATAGWVGHTIKSRNQTTDVVAKYVDGGLNMISDRINLFMTNAGGPGATSSSKGSNWDKAALFTGQVGWKERIYADFSYRQDWYRAFRQFKDRGVDDNYGYFGVGLNAIISDLARLPEWWNYFKYRLSYAEVGNSIPNTVYSKGSENLRTGAITSSTWSTFRNPVPEKTNSFETGVEMLFFNNKLNFDFTFYNSIMKNLYMIASNASGLAEPVNSGKVRNRGFETTIGYNFIFNNDWRWKTQFNFSYNNNKILETTYEEDGTEKLLYTDLAGVRVRYTKGGSIGDMYVRDLHHNEDGTLFMSEGGKLLTERRYTKYIGNMNSKYQLGWSNTISYKDFQLYFLINGRIGGKVISLTEAYLDNLGLSQHSAAARQYAEANGLYTASGELAMYLPDGSGRLIGVQDYYQTVGATGSQYTPNYIYDATNFRLRELSLGYTFRNLLGENKNLSVSFIGRNLFFIYKDSPVDPDISLSTGNGLGGFEIFNLPSTRSFGFNVKVNF